MSRSIKIILIVGVIGVAAAVGWFASRSGGGVSEAQYARNFLKGCEPSARQGLINAGRPAQAAEAQAKAYCACALEVVAPLPMSDKRELDKGGPRAQQIAAETRSKCLR